MFEGVITQTTLAHRLLTKAWHMGEGLFKAYFEDAKNVGDIQVLAEIAASVGLLSEKEAVKFLQSDEYLSEVEKQMVEVRRKGVTGVPFVVIDGKWAVSGGQNAETYVQIFKKIGKSDKPSPVPSAPTCVGSA
ncbi:hypothetical protein QCA50_005882 [Cerrena zonata]|uniref:DSBA-like thioredoxin domain-containing protein n=1 Tax=Cerrena zonata TaxID=2478898 RepID=A0AAW0GGE8_9APHY